MSLIKNAKLIETSKDGSFLKAVIRVDSLDEEDVSTLKDWGSLQFSVGDSLTINFNLPPTPRWTEETIGDFVTNRAEWVLGKLSDEDAYCVASDFLVEMFESIEDARIPTQTEEKESDV